MFDLLNQVPEGVQKVQSVQIVPWRFLDGDKKVNSLNKYFERFERQVSTSLEPVSKLSLITKLIQACYIATGLVLSLVYNFKIKF